MNSLANDFGRLSVSTRAYFDRIHAMFIGGAWRPAGSGAQRDLVDPSSGQVFASIPEAEASDVHSAVESARAALTHGPWPRLKPYRREELLLELANRIAANAGELAEIEAVNSGRLLANTRLFDVDLSIYVLRYYAGWVTKLHGQTVNLSVPYLPEAEFMGLTRREPLGVVAGIVPWNVPLCQAVWKVAPALAAGCTVVLKPSELTPLTALRLGELVEQSGFPPGVVNVVTGSGGVVGAALVAHPGVDRVSFTGSTAVGKQIAAQAASSLKRVSLELGGKSPVVVLEDADLDEAIAGAAWAIFGNHGQNCCAGSRLYVHERIFQQVMEGVVEVARGIKLGPGLDPTSQMGPLVSRQQQRRVLDYVEKGKREGVQVMIGGRAPEGPGSYVEPTILAGARQDMAVVREEIFGPVLAAMPFGTNEEALELANDSSFGLGASVWTRSLALAQRFAKGFKAGTVWVNTHNVLDVALPFGGVKESGLGHDLGEEALLANTTLKAVVVRA